MVKKETRKDSLLRLIFDIGGEGTREQINAKVPKYWELSKEELEIERGTTKPLYWHRVASVCQALKDRDHYLENPKWGVWKITEKGKEYLFSKSHEPSVGSGGPAGLPTAEDSDLVIKLRSAQRNSGNPAIFEEALTEAFNTLGFSARHTGGAGKPDILLKNPNYKVVVNAKSTKEGVISNARFDADERDKDNYNADCLAYVGPGFSEGYMRETAEKRGFILIETEAICKILQNREIYEPDRIVEILFKSGKHLITPKEITPSSTVKDLIKIIANIMPILKNFEKADIASFSKDTLRTALIAQGNIFAIDDVETALKFLSTTPFSILQKQNDEYSLTSGFEFIQRKIGILRQAFER